jgi:hypothetical protein
MFCSARGSTLREEPYGLADQLIDLGLGLHEPTGIHEVSTFDPKKIVDRRLKLNLDLHPFVQL